MRQAGEQRALEVPGGEAATRQGDPEESYSAAASTGNLTVNQRSVMTLMRVLGKPVLDEELIKAYERHRKALLLPEQSESGLRSRRSELSNAGLLTQGESKKMTTGGTGRTWTLTPKETT